MPITFSHSTTKSTAHEKEKVCFIPLIETTNLMKCVFTAGRKEDSDLLHNVHDVES